MKIAVIGSGFAGLATAWHLLSNQSTRDPVQITIFDDLGVGGQASGIAAGLLHPFAGLHAKLNRFGKEGFKSSSKLLEASSKAFGADVYKQSGLLRLSLTASQCQDYLKCSKLNDNVDFLTPLECRQLVPCISAISGIHIKEAITVFTKNYLEGLFLSCQQMGATFEHVKIESLNDLNHFDLVVVTAGMGTNLFLELKSMPITFLKGQILELEWPKEIKPLSIPISSQSYIVMSQDMKSCIVGATFEKQFSSLFEDPGFAESDIMPKVIALIPALSKAKIMNCKAAIRVSTRDHLPIIKKIHDRLFVFTGLGSKGLLYHSYYAEKLCEMIKT